MEADRRLVFGPGARVEQLGPVEGRSTMDRTALVKLGPGGSFELAYDGARSGRSLLSLRPRAKRANAAVEAAPVHPDGGSQAEAVGLLMASELMLRGQQALVEQARKRLRRLAARLGSPPVA